MISLPLIFANLTLIFFGGHFRDRLIKIASGVEKNEPHLGVDFEPRTSRKDQMNESISASAWFRAFSVFRG